MNGIKTKAIVLRNRRFSESSLVVTLLGRECGRLDVLAKGCRREKNPMHGHLDLYQEEEVLVLRRPAASLDLLIEAAFVDEHVGLRFNTAAFAAAGLLADFAASATLPGETLVEMYDVLSGALGVLSGLGEPGARAGLSPAAPFGMEEKTLLVERTLKLALVDMLGWLGFGLELGRCVVCGREGELGAGAGLGMRQGGALCGDCGKKAGGGVTVTGMNALRSLRERGPGGERFELALGEKERRRLLRFLTEYCQHALEKPLRSKRVLSQLMKGL